MYDELLFLYVKPATTFFVTVSIQSVFPIRYEFVGGTDITLYPQLSVSQQEYQEWNPIHSCSQVELVPIECPIFNFKNIRPLAKSEEIWKISLFRLYFLFLDNVA